MNWEKLSTLSIENISHIGSIVPNLDHSMREMSAQIGATWTTPIVSDATLELADGPHTTFGSRVVMSLQGPPYLELIEGSADPRSIWSIAEGPRFHHIGYYVENWRQEVKRLEALGLTVEAVGSGMAYVRDAMGIRLEVMSWKGKNLVYDWIRGAPDKSKFERAQSGR